MEDHEHPSRRVVAHLDADAFYASIHVREDPSLEGLPVIVAGSGARSIVTTASYEARSFGVHSAQPAAKARRLCPHGVFIRPDFELYRGYSSRAAALMRELTDQIEPLSLDEAYLDLSLLDAPVAAVRELVASIHDATGLTYSVGIGPNKLCAKVLSDHRKPAAFNAASREQCCELFADASPAIIPGFGPKTVAQLAEVGIDALADVRAAPLDVLEVRFGARRGAELRQRAAFVHDGAVVAEREPKSASEERTFEQDVEGMAQLEPELDALCEDLAERLDRRSLAGRTIGIKLRSADFSTITRARTVSERTADPAVISAIARELLRANEPSRPIRLLGVRVSGFEDPSPSRRAGCAEQLQLELQLQR